MLKVGQSLQQLETLRNEDWHEDFISQCLQEFENINWTTELCIERINNCKLKKQFGTTKFAEFIEDDDLIVDNELIELKAMILLQERNFVDVSTYQTLIKYYHEQRDSIIKDSQINVIQYEVQIKNKLRSMINALYKTFIEKVYESGFLENKQCEKATAELFKSMEIEIENFKLKQ